MVLEVVRNQVRFFFIFNLRPIEILCTEGRVKLIKGENNSLIYTCCPNCSNLSFSACLGSSSSDCKGIFQNPQIKLEKEPLFYLQSVSADHKSRFDQTAELPSNA